MKEQTLQSTIYIGLNDAETGVQKFSIEKYVSVLKNVCRSYQVAFSVYNISGGYFHEDGRYTEENTLTLMLLGVPQETVIEIAKDLCAFFHQEKRAWSKNAAEPPPHKPSPFGEGGIAHEALRKRENTKCAMTDEVVRLNNDVKRGAAATS